MTQTTLEKTIALLEREISGTRETEKTRIGRRLRVVRTPLKSAKSGTADDDDDMFNNMPV